MHSKALLERKITQQASQKFGPKVPTLQKYLRKVREMVDAGLSLYSALQLKALEFQPPGPRPLLSQDELDLLVSKADNSADHGKGFSTRRLSAEAKRFCATIAQENDPKMRERLENAKCGVSHRDLAPVQTDLAAACTDSGKLSKSVSTPLKTTLSFVPLATREQKWRRRFAGISSFPTRVHSSKSAKR